KSTQLGSKIAFRKEGYFVAAGGGFTWGLSPAMMARSFVVPKGCGSTVLLMSVVPFMNVNGTRSWLLLQGLLRRPKVGCEPSLPRMAPTGIAESSGTEGESATTPPKL